MWKPQRGTVVRFQLDQRSDVARRPEDAMLPAILLSGGAYVALDWALSGVIGGYWGGLVATAVTTMPTAALLRMAFSARTPRQAVCDGGCCGIAVAGLNAWVFTAPFVSLPGF